MAIVGAGPLGLAALLMAQFYSPAAITIIDLGDKRLEIARPFSATKPINGSDGQIAQTVMDLTGPCGVDNAIETVGTPARFEPCDDLVGSGGTIVNIGVHGIKADLHQENLWDRHITITTWLAGTVSMPMLLNRLSSPAQDRAQTVD